MPDAQIVIPFKVWGNPARSHVTVKLKEDMEFVTEYSFEMVDYSGTTSNNVIIFAMKDGEDILQEGFEKRLMSTYLPKALDKIFKQLKKLHKKAEAAKPPPPEPEKHEETISPAVSADKI